MAILQSQMFSRRKFLKGAGVVAVGASMATLAACAPPTAAPAASAPGAPAVLKGATVKFLGGPWSFLPALDTVIEEFANDWAKQNNVTMTFERDAQLLPKIQTAIETKGGANIIQYSSPPAIFANALVDVKDIVDELDKEGGGYLPNAPYQMVRDGKWLGAPLGQHNWFVNYRQDWLKEEGYDTFPDTWEEALKAAPMG
jgi:ABC-type glycerol-3-phosphate transport system substrate-binding protein